MIDPARRRETLATLLGASARELDSWDLVCGYFGQLYAGRGIEIIESMAAARSSSLFLVFGGSEADVRARKLKAPSNLRFMGHVPNPFARAAQAAVDVLLMPYQLNVSIGVKGQDTGRWMSPMKMFEYLAAGVPIIASDLPVLREVLIDTKNSLLVPAAEIDKWIVALDKIKNDKILANSIGAQAHSQYRDQHTWRRRAEILLSSAGSA
jgi:glycosyltransferase involved in cell wall biosynthesis